MDHISKPEDEKMQYSERKTMLNHLDTCNSTQNNGELTATVYTNSSVASTKVASLPVTSAQLNFSVDTFDNLKNTQILK